MQFLLRTITHILVISLIFPYNPVYAANITDVAGLVPDGSTNTFTDRAPNNTPIVNIAAPSAGGVSLNNWSDYNVSVENQILNNAKGATVNTNLAGQIYGNPNFNPSGVNEANTIVNQVTGNNRTSINGATEIAGRKANIIIANGNGIDIAGASYINTSGLSLVTGLVNINGGGAIDSFTLSNQANSNVIITGVNSATYANLGLDASTVDYVDIITRSAQVLGDIYAKNEINFKIGNHKYDYASKTISSDSSLGAATKPIFALDSSYLGGMYVGKITLTATESGIGVRTRGDLVSNAADIVFNVAGDIDYERLNANTNINLTSTGGKITQGKYATISRPAITYAKGDITLTGANGIELNDSSQANNFYAAGLISLNSANNLIKNNSTIKAEAGLTINSASFENTSLVFSLDNLSIATTGLTKNTAGTIEAIKNVTINSGSFNNASLIRANNNLEITSEGNFVDSSQIKASGNLSITANTGIFYNDLESGEDLTITNNISGDINHGYKSYSLKNTNITNNGGNIILGLTNNSNSGMLYSKANLNLVTNSNIINNSNIFSEAKINLTTKNLTNNMRLMAIGVGLGENSSNLTINLDQKLINYGLLYANQDINLNVDGTVTNDAANNNAGEIFALNGNVNINSIDGKNYATKVENLNGAKIISSFGDINIKALTVNNIAKDNKDVVANPENAVRRTQYRGIGWAWRSTVLWGYDNVESTLDSERSYLQAGKNINIEAINILNNSSTITAGNKIGIKTTNLSNTRTQFSVSVPYIYETHWKTDRRWDNEEGRYLTWYSNTALLYSNTASVISSGNSLDISAIGNVSIDVPTIDTNLVGMHPLQKESNPNKPNQSSWQIEIPTTNNGLFNKAAPDKSYLVESAYNANDENALTGSNYYKSRFGFDPNQSNIKWLGDPFYEWNALNQQIIVSSGRQKQWVELDWKDNFNQLIDNAHNQQGDLALVPGIKLTEKQISALKSDIVWYETEEIKLADGSIQKVAVPHVYLAKNSVTKIDFNSGKSQESAILSNNIKINAGGNLNNHGLILATADSNQPSGTSGNLAITTSQDIINKSTIKADNSVTLNSDQNIINNSTVNSIVIDHNGGTDTFSNISKTATIEAGKISINAGNDFENLAAQIRANKNDLGGGVASSGNIAINAGDDITISTLELRNRSESKWGSKKKGGSNITDTTTNIGSEIASAGNLTLTTTGLGTNNEKATVDAKYATAQTQYNSDLVVYNQAVADYPAKLAAYNDALAVYNSKTSSRKKEHLTPPAPPVVPVAPVLPVYSEIQASVDNGGSDIKIVGSNISTTTNGSNIAINSNDSVNIASAVDSSYKMETSNKKGTIVQKSSVSINSSTTNVASNITSLGDVSITSGLDTNIIASNISGSGSGSIISGGDTNIFNATDTSYSHSESTKTRTGLLRQLPVFDRVISVLNTVYSPYLSLANGLSGGNLATFQRIDGTEYSKSNVANSSTTEKLITSNLNFGNNLTIGSNADLTVKASNLKTTSGDITLAANGDVNILSAAQTSTTNRNYRDKSDRAKERGNANTTNITNISSTITSGSDLTIVSGDDVAIQSSKLSSGDNLTIDAGNNLLLLTASDASVKNEENKGGTAYTFRNGTSGYVNVKAVNNEITSNTNGTINSNLSLNATNSILAQYRASTMEDVLSSTNNDNQQLAYLKTVNDLAQADPNKVTLDPISDTIKQWDQTTRGLTGAGQAVIAVAAIAATIVTAGAAAPALAAAAAAGAVTVGTTSFVVVTAVASSAIATASVSATNASMNTDSSLWGSAKSISSKSWRATTSEESLQNMAIAGITAGITFGAGAALSGTSTAVNAGNGASAATGTGAAANTSTAIYVNPNLSNPTVLTTSATNSSSFFTNLGNAGRNIAIATTTNIAATSLVKGQSISEVIANQGGADRVILSSALQALAQAGAMQIGNAAHGSLTPNSDGTVTYNAPTISQGQQLVLHAALGCGIGAGMSGGGSGCASGAVSAVVGELTGKFASNSGLNNSQVVAVSGLAGGLSAVFTGSLTGDDDNKIAKNVYLGQTLGSNAAQNNFIQGKMMDEKVQLMWLEGKVSDSEYQQYQQIRNQGDRIAGEIVLGAATLADGIALYQGARALATSSKAGRIFWSGSKEAKIAATEFAQTNGMTTLEMTRAGQNLENLIQTNNIPWSRAKPMWERLSTTYAKGTTGEAHFFGGNTINPESIWLGTEKPILTNNGINIITH